MMSDLTEIFKRKRRRFV